MLMESSAKSTIIILDLYNRTAWHLVKYEPTTEHPKLPLLTNVTAGKRLDSNLSTIKLLYDIKNIPF